MNEQQLEILEKTFALGGMIVFKHRNGKYRVVSFGPACPAMEELTDLLADNDGPLCDLLNKHYPMEPN